MNKASESQVTRRRLGAATTVEKGELRAACPEASEETTKQAEVTGLMGS